MSTLEIVALAFSLSLDCFAVSLALSASGYLNDRRAAFRISFHFGLFQSLMPIAGWSVGAQLEPYIASFDHWIAFGLLTFVAVRMILGSRETPSTEPSKDPSRGWTLVTLSTATSIDALAVGLGLAALGIEVWYPSVVIGSITLIVSVLAIMGGRRAQRSLGSHAQVLGAAVLLIIAVKVLFSHTL
jgi:manganese efflux pump family protein